MVRALDYHQFGLGSGLPMYARYGFEQGPVIIYCLGWGGGEDFREDHLIFGRAKEGISRN